MELQGLFLKWCQLYPSRMCHQPSGSRGSTKQIVYVSPAETKEAALSNPRLTPKIWCFCIKILAHPGQVSRSRCPHWGPIPAERPEALVLSPKTSLSLAGDSSV